MSFNRLTGAENFFYAMHFWEGAPIYCRGVPPEDHVQYLIQNHMRGLAQEWSIKVLQDNSWMSMYGIPALRDNYIHDFFVSKNAPAIARDGPPHTKEEDDIVVPLPKLEDLPRGLTTFRKDGKRILVLVCND